MSSYQKTILDLLTLPSLNDPALPLIIDDYSLALHLGVRCRTLWWAVLRKHTLYTTFCIPKANGKSRIIDNPKKPLKYLQHQIYRKILSKLALLDCVGAYVPGRSCYDSAKRHCQHAIRIGMDLKNFFPSHRRVDVRNYFHQTLGYTHQVAGLLADLCTVKRANNRHEVPQGSPASPALCNLIAQEHLDRPLLAFLENTGWVYTRYSDDLTFSHPEDKSRREVKQFLETVHEHVTRAGYHLHPKKFKIQRHWRRQHMLGMVINEHPNIARETYRKYRSILYNCEHQGFLPNLIQYGGLSSHSDTDLSALHSFVAHLRGKISYFKTVNFEKGTLLEAQLTRALAQQPLFVDCFEKEEKEIHDDCK